MLIFISIFLGFFSLQIYNLIIIEKKKEKQISIYMTTINKFYPFFFGIKHFWNFFKGKKNFSNFLNGTINNHRIDSFKITLLLLGLRGLRRGSSSVGTRMLLLLRQLRLSLLPIVLLEPILLMMMLLLRVLMMMMISRVLLVEKFVRHLHRVETTKRRQIV